jgi:hypothetical protein
MELLLAPALSGRSEAVPPWNFPDASQLLKQSVARVDMNESVEDLDPRRRAVDRKHLLSVRVTVPCFGLGATVGAVRSIAA